MNAIHAVWSEVRVPQLNRLLKNFGVRLVQTRSKKWGEKSTITGTYLEGGLPKAATIIIAEKVFALAALEDQLTSERKSAADATAVLLRQRSALIENLLAASSLLERAIDGGGVPQGFGDSTRCDIAVFRSLIATMQPTAE